MSRLPPLDGSLTLPEIVNFYIQHNDQQAMYIHAGNDDQLVTISYLGFGRACHRVAQALQPSGYNYSGDVVAIIALADPILYHSITVGSMLAGLVPFPISPRNPPAAILNMLKKTNCHRIVSTQATLKPLLQGILLELKASDESYKLSMEEIPSLLQAYPHLGSETAADPFEPFPKPTVQLNLENTALYLHSSGSTGFPKPIPQTHLTISHWSCAPTVMEMRASPTPIFTATMGLPSFHVLGIYLQLFCPLYSGQTTALQTLSGMDPAKPPTMPTPDDIIEQAKKTKANAVVAVPAYIQAWAQSPSTVTFLSSLAFVGWSGGVLSAKIGDALTAAGVILVNVYGATEFGPVTGFLRDTVPSHVDWSYVRFGERLKLRWVAQGDGSSECQVLTSPTHQVSVENLSDMKGYATSDLFQEHPIEKGYWKILGRIDDTIVHSSGEKIVPAPMENEIMASPLIRAVLMFGEMRNQTGIIVEPAPSQDVSDDVKTMAFIQRIWPILEAANKTIPAFSRIFREMVLIAKPEKPMPRTGKGTVMRKAALELYKNEIDQVYSNIEGDAQSDSISLPQSWSVADIQTWLSDQWRDMYPEKPININVDLFDQGFDSLGATILRSRILSALRSFAQVKTQVVELVARTNVVFTHPTINGLSSYLAGAISQPERAGDHNGIDGPAAMQIMLEKYCKGLGRWSEHSDYVVLLTGSTGHLGSHFLHSLLNDGRVSRIYALNRSSASESVLKRQTTAFTKQGFSLVPLSSPKLFMVETNISERNLGLTDEMYDQMRSSVDIIIHNAWRLDFNISLFAFESHIRSTRNLVDFALSSGKLSHPRLLFMSSIETARCWDKGLGDVPESLVLGPSAAAGSGYGSGKYIAEQIVASKGLDSSSIRIGQICGSLLSGAWASTDWVPVMIKSSVTLGALPDMPGLVSWLPMDAVSKSVLEIAFHSHALPPVAHLVHPRPVPWTTIITAVRDALKVLRSIELSIVPFGEWFDALQTRSQGATAKDLANIPAIKLEDFFRALNAGNATARGHGSAEAGGTPTYSTLVARASSPAISNLEPTRPEDVERWVKFWVYEGFL